MWDDILRAGSSDTIAVHFIGSIVYVEQGLSQVTHQAPLLVIDGQQRLTTVSLLIEALARALGDDEPVDGFSAAKLRHYYLSNPLESGDRYFKLLLSQTDNASLKAVIKNTEQPKEPSLRVTQNFDLFTELLAEQKGDLAPVCRGLAKLVVVDIALSRDQDNPQLIFESMNSTGKELSQADLIRNFILMGLEPALQTRLYEEYWRPMEQDFGQEAYGTQFDSFMRHYLTVRTGDIPREREVYEAFKDYSRTTPVQGRGHRGAGEGDPRLRALLLRDGAGRRAGRQRSVQAFHDLRELKVDVAYPFLLELYHDYANDTAQRRRLRSRGAAGRGLRVPPRHLRHPHQLDEQDLRHLRQGAQEGPLPREHPGALPDAALLSPLSRATKSSAATCRPATSTISQPQLLAAPAGEPRPQGARAGGRVHHRAHPAAEPRPPGGVASRRSDRSGSACSSSGCTPSATSRSPATTPSTATALSPRSATWRAASSRARSSSTRGLASSTRGTKPRSRSAPGGSPIRRSRCGRRPGSMPQRFAAYQPAKVPATGGYTIDDHPHLLSTAGMREVFEAFRKEVLALDPCVTEEFMKLYVAYKAETNFVDVVPQAKRLRLSLNMAFPEINDPKGLCRDVTARPVGQRRRGGRPQVARELPYVMGLVRQSYERQMGDGGQA